MSVVHVRPGSDGSGLAPGALRTTGAETVGASRSSRRLRRVLLGVDAAAAGGAWLLVLHPWRPGEISSTALAGVVAGIVGATLALLQLQQLYLARVCRVRAVELSRLARVAALVGASAYLLGGRAEIAIDGRVAVQGAVLSFVALAAGRSLYTSWLKGLRSQGQASRPVVVVGRNEEGKHLRSLLERHPELGFTVVASAASADEVAPALKRYRADAVVIAVSALERRELNELTRRLLDSGVHVHLSCGLAGVDHSRIRRMPLAHEPLFYLERRTVSKPQVVVSRAVDIVGSVVGLALTLPIMAVAAVLIKAQDGGPVLFRHERIGRNGRPFMLYKLRTMVPDAESRLSLVEATNRRDGPLFKSANDVRVTRVGRVLRATSIDELPQLVNVLFGSMSLVGPRPALAHEVERFDPELLRRLQVRPGITGLWQVEARHDPSFESYRKLDLFYLDNWSLELDLVILLRTAKGLLGQALHDLRRQRRSSLPPAELPREVEASPAPVPVP